MHTRLVVTLILCILIIITTNASTKRKRQSSKIDPQNEPTMTYWQKKVETEKAVVNMGYTAGHIRQIIMDYVFEYPFPDPISLCPSHLTHPNNNQDFTGATFSADGLFVAISCNVHLHVYGMKSGRRLCTVIGNEYKFGIFAHQYVFANDASFIVSSFGCLKVWYSNEQNRRVQNLTWNLSEPVQKLHISADNTVLVCKQYNKISMWNIPSGTLTRTIDFQTPYFCTVHTTHLSRDQTILYVNVGPTVFQYSIESGTALNSYTIPPKHWHALNLTENRRYDERFELRPGKDNQSFVYGTGQGVYEHTFGVGTVQYYDHKEHLPVCRRYRNHPEIEFWKRTLMLGDDFMIIHNVFVTNTDRARGRDRIMYLIEFSSNKCTKFSSPKNCQCWVNSQPANKPWGIFYDEVSQSFQIIDLKEYSQKNKIK